jgi:hypothetical protein
MSFATDCSTFSNYHHYYTTEKDWSLIKHLIPKNIVIWEACMLESHLSTSPQILEKLTGNKVIYDVNWDFLNKDIEPPEYDMIITNPPFETNIKKDILKRLIEINKPFIIISNSTNTHTNYFREIFKNHLHEIQIIIPNTKLTYNCLQDDNTLKEYKNMGFYSVFVAFKMNLLPEQLWC